MSQNIIPNSVEFIKDKFYFLPKKPPKFTFSAELIDIDDKLTYDSFNKDFGPLNLGKLYQYSNLIENKLKNSKNTLIHYSCSGPENLANAIYLAASFMILLHKKNALDMFILIKKSGINLVPFRDASMMPNKYTISLKDILQGLEKAFHIGLIDFKKFNLDDYDYYEKVENGDMNWILPGKLLAFCGPEAIIDKKANFLKNQKESPLPGVSNVNCNHHPPSFYIPYFKEHNVKMVIRLNEPDKYNAIEFTHHGIMHRDLFFPDGGCPSEALVQAFLDICYDDALVSPFKNRHSFSGAIAVHCKAGLGRTGTLIACYLMSRYKFTALEAIGWIRICRPGSVLGHQQNFLEKMQPSLWSYMEKYAASNHAKSMQSEKALQQLPSNLLDTICEYQFFDQNNPDNHSRSPHKLGTPHTTVCPNELPKNCKNAIKYLPLFSKVGTKNVPFPLLSIKTGQHKI